MSFLFGKKKQSHQTPHSATRETTTSGVISSSSSIPTTNGTKTNEKRLGGAKSPPPGPASLPTFGNVVNNNEAYAPSSDRVHDQPGPPAQDLTFATRFGQNGSSQPDRNPNIAYPWTQRRLKFTSSQANPFPRYGAAVNAVSSKEGNVYLMGGLVGSSAVKGDLWMIEAGSGNLACYPINSTVEGPGPRIGHASLLVGNAFIVFGGDTNMGDRDRLDDALYLLNTSTRHWSRSLPPAGRPAGRYGHTLNILGSKIYVFGGQVEGHFFNDLIAFDLNTLQNPRSTWEKLPQNNSDGTFSEGQVPPARTNHSIVSWNDKLYLFGGTNGTHWFNDVWSYDPAIGAWSQLECIGYIPAPREGHSAALVNDVMYIFGGRTEEGADLGDLAAFRLTSRRWYTFQNMGPSPSPRSGHSMTAFGNQIIVLAGEPSIALPDVEELSLVYILDTSKIRYPNDQQSQQVSSAERVHGNGRPSIERSAASQVRGTQRDVLAGPGEELEKKSTGSHEAAPLEAKKSDFAARYGGHPQDMSTGSGASGPVPGSRLPRVSIAQSPSGPSPQQQALPPRFNGAMHRSRAVPKDNRISEAATDVNRATSTNREHVVPIQLSIPGDGPKQAPLVRAPGPDIRSQLTPNLQSIQTPRSLTVNSGFENVQRLNEDLQQNSREHPKQQFLNEKPEVSGPNMQHPQNFSDQRKDADRSNGKEVPIIQNSLPVQHATLGNSRQEALMKDFEAEKTRCSWYASELALARKAGYQQILSKSPILQEAAELFFGEEEMPLIEALVAIRARLAEVQMSVDSRVSAAALEVTEIEQQRDVAVREAAYAKAKLAAHLDVQVRPTSTEPTSRGTSDESRRKEISRKLAAALLTQTELQSTISLMTAELQAERLAREVAEGSAEAAQKFAAEINQLWNPGEVESLRIELHNLGKAVRDEAVQKPKAHATQQQLVLEKDALAQRLGDTLEVNRQHSKLFISFREAVGVSDSKALLLERKLEEERMKREAVDQKLLTLTAVHEERMTELETMGSKLQTAEDLAETHATEARTYREVVLAGLDKMKSGDLSEQAIELTDERVSILRQQVEDAHAAAKQMQENGNDALEKLRNAEQRIAGLEAYQIQSSREKLSLQKQLQDEVRVKRSFQNKYDTAQQQLTSQQRDANALSVQHDALKELLVERGIGEFGVSKYTSFSTSDGHRLREPEQKFSMNIKDLEEMKASFEMREQEADRAFREKLEQLEQDYQSAVHYVKGTEKMLNRMKEELAKSKAQNKRLQEELHRSRSMESDAAAEWEKERHSLRQEIGEIQESVKESVYQLERQMKEVHAELYTTQESRDHLRHLNEQAQKELVQASQRPSAELDQLKSENIMLQSRAMDAEKKVTLLLDQVNTSIGNYRRRSQQKHGSGLHLPNLLPSTTPQETDFEKRSFVMHQSFARNASENIETANIRNSTALESLASELESLRTHWEGTNRDHNFELDRSPITPETVGGGDIGHSLTSWRKRLDNDDGGQRSNDEETEHDFIMSSPSGKRKSISAVHGFIAIGAEGDGDAETAEKIFDEREGTDSHQLVKPRSLTAGGGKGVAQPAVTS